VRYNVVCVSRSLGAGGEAVGRGVAERLGFRYVDDEVIALASEKAGIDPAVVAKAEEHTTLLSRLMDALAATPMEVERLLPLKETSADRIPRARWSETLPEEELRRFIQAAIAEIADRGNAVIVAHGASIALAGRKDVLRTLVTASVATRRGRLWPGRLLNEQEAARAVAESDVERARYLQRFFDVSEEVPTLYDLVINTDAVDIEQGTAAIVGAVAAAGQRAPVL
jgi:cytidylate kinase